MSVKHRLMLSVAVIPIISAVLTVIVSVLLIVVFVIADTNLNLNNESLVFDKTMFWDSYMFKFIVIWFVCTVVCFAATGAVAGIKFCKSTVLPLKRLAVGVEHMKNGDLSYEFIGSGDMELKEIFDAFEELRLRLQRNVNCEIENDKLRQQLLVNLSHDIKTPVTSIKGYIEGLRDGVASTDEMREKYIKTIYSKADLIERLADNLSVYSKLEVGKMQYSMTYIDMKEYIPKIAEEYEMDLNIADIRLSVKLCDEPIVCMGDPDNLRRVFSNIITNAIKYQNKNNKGSNNKGNLEISAKRDKAGILISFADRGRGVPNEDLERIFDGFYRADTSRNSAVPGNGLGLSVCKRIIEDHGGRIWARNRSGGGCEFIMIIPEAF